MLAPEPKAAKLIRDYWKLFEDPRRATNEFVLRRCLQDLRAAVKEAPREFLWNLFNGIGMCHLLLNEPAKALEAFRNGVRYNPKSVVVESNIAAALIDLGQNREALRQIEATAAKGGLETLGELTLWGNAAESHSSLGELADARIAFERAVQKLDPRDPTHMTYNLRLARHAQLCGYEADAAEFVARYVLGLLNVARDPEHDAGDVLRAHPEEANEAVLHIPELAAIVAEHLASPPHAPTDDETVDRTTFELDAPAWEKLCALAELSV
jgi:tetratricopeptide (TPR) repeat protein